MSAIGVAGNDLFIGGNIDLLMELLILISLTWFPGILDISICDVYIQELSMLQLY